MRRRLLLSVVPLLCALLCVVDAQQAHIATPLPVPTVFASDATFVGINEVGAISFVGIRFASACRFCPPKPVEAAGIVNATVYGALCPQQPTTTHRGIDLSEDCLFLNVHVPTDYFEQVIRPAGQIIPDTARKLPVVVHIHGGSFTGGSGTFNLFNPSVFTSKGIIYVSMNYRLGLFGFWRNPELTAKQPSAPTNFGLLDQQAALDWIHKYIQYFGGDASHITAMGESAGAISILNHLASRRHLNETKLFHRAIIQNAVVMESPRLNLRDGYFVGSIWADAVGCNEPGQVLSCMMEKPMMELVRPNFFRWTPLENDYLLSNVIAPIEDSVNFAHVRAALAAGKFDSDVDIIIGNSKDEGSLFAFLCFPILSPSETKYRQFMQVAFPEHAPQVLELYNPANRSIWWTFVELLNDIRFHCPNRRGMLWLQDKITSKSVRRYVWNHQPDHSWDFLGVYHSVETAFIHNTPGGFQIYPKYFTAAETELAQKMGELWAKFIFDELTEDEWPHYKADTEDYLSIGDNGPSFIPKRGYRVTECEFWDTAYPEGPEIIEHDMAYFEETHANWLNEGVIILLNNGILVKSIGQKALWVILLIAVVRLLYVRSRTSPAKLKTN